MKCVYKVCIVSSVYIKIVQAILKILNRTINFEAPSQIKSYDRKRKINWVFFFVIFVQRYLCCEISTNSLTDFVVSLGTTTRCSFYIFAREISKKMKYCILTSQISLNTQNTMRNLKVTIHYRTNKNKRYWKNSKA